MKRAKCIWAACKGITVGKVYLVLLQDNEMIWLFNDNGQKTLYHRSNFAV